MTKTRKALLNSIIALVLCFSMLLGTTWAWFTDSVTSSNNIIQSGMLKTGMEYADDLSGDSWQDASTGSIFDYQHWEPGFTQIKYIKVNNKGNLAFKYLLNIAPNGAVTKLAEVIDVYCIENPTQLDGRADLPAEKRVGSLMEVINGKTIATGALLPEGKTDENNTPAGAVTLALAMKMREDAGNEYQNLSLSANPEGQPTTFAVKLLATQNTYESDSFDDQYDEESQWPGLNLPEGGVNVSTNVTVDGEGKLAADATMTSGEVSATVPAGVAVNDGTTALTLSVSEKENSESNVTTGTNEELMALDVHIEGISADNTTPILVNLGKVLPEGMNLGNVALYHVEGGETNVMEQVMSLSELDEHNEFYYDPATGCVTVAMATFSEVAIVAEEPRWEGEFDYTWYDASKTELTISNADQLAAFGAIVGKMAEGIEQDSFSGKTVKLISDINLGDDENHNDTGKIFYPIGYWNNEGTYERKPVEERTTAVESGLYTFNGTFDGNGHTISNFYQNTWEMKGDHNWYDPIKEQYYRDGMGLFGRVYGGTVKNLTVKNFSSDGEIATTGVIAAYADGATFENIAIFNCNPRVYNIGNGGIVGCVGWYAKEADLKTTFKNITVDNSNKISALWGSYDVACGGIVGQYYPTSGQTSAGTPKNAGIHMENCHISAQMDVYNDVCANYQYYAYRYTGMLIGSVRENVTIDGHSYPKMDGITASGCTVHFGTWNDYYYCEITDNTTASYTHDYQMSRLEQVTKVDGTTITPLKGESFTVPSEGRYNYVVVSGEHATENATCYHFKDGAVWTHDMGGIQTGIDENGDGQDDLKEDKQHIYLEFNNLVTGYGWGVTSKGVDDLDGVTILDRAEGDSVKKFDGKVDTLTTDRNYTIDEIFAYIEDCGVKVVDNAVNVTITNLVENGNVKATFTRGEKWNEGTICFENTGNIAITIQDYYFCEATTITVKVTERAAEEKFDVVMNNGDFLHRVGNSGTVALDKLFKAKEGVTVGTVSVTVEAVDGTAASGTYTSNATWTNGTIKFSDTGVVKVTITDNDFCIPTVLYLEVVDAKNITSATGTTTGGNFVLLCDVNTSTYVNYWNCTLYGNGFTYSLKGAPTAYNSKQGHGILITKNATLDNLVIVGDVYESYGVYTDQEDYTSAIDATNTIIQNCYVANCSTPIRANGVTVKDTTLYGGTVANLIIAGGTNTLKNVTTVNYKDGRGILGLGIIVSESASNTTKIILNGDLKQYNYVCVDDVSDVPDDDAKQIFDSMFKDSFKDYRVTKDGKTYVNTGIIIMTEALNTDIITDNRTIKYKAKDDAVIEIKAIIGTSTVDGAVYAPSGGTVDNNYVAANDKKNQGDYLPTFMFDLGDQMLAKDNDDDTCYLIGDKNGLTAMYPKGESAITLDLTKLATVSKYTGTSYPVTAKCTGPDGTEQTGTVTLNEKGAYTLVFTAEDNIFYDKDGNTVEKSVTRTYEVPLVLDLYEKSIADATMTINSSNLTGDYINSGTNKKYKMYPLKAITSIMDDANKDGTLETFDFKNNIQSAVLTPESNNAFSSPTTITITYAGGQVLTIVLGTPSGLNSPGASNGGKTFSVTTDSTNGIYLQSDGAVASSSAATGTWPLTSWSFKGTSGKVITDNTKVTIDFTKPTGTSPCVTADTLLMLADGSQKRIDAVTYADQLMAWDFYKGEFTTVSSAIIFDHGADHNTVIELKFSDGTAVKMVNLHQFYDADLSKFVSIDAEHVADFVGHKFAKQSGNGCEMVTLVDYVVSHEYTEAWGIISTEQYNILVEGMISTDFMREDYDLFNYFEIGDDMKFDTEKMQADVEQYGLYTYEDFADYLTYEQFVAFNVQYFKIAVGKGTYTYEGILELIDTYLNH